MAREAAPADDRDDKRARVAELLEQVAARRLAGDSVPDAELITAHPELAPELAEKLSALHVVELARNRADGACADPAGRRGSSGGREAGFPSPLLKSLSGYEVLRRIKGGGQGVVYEARQKATDRSVAIKVTRESPFGDTHDRARFEREVRVLGALKHPNIVTIHESGAADDLFYFVMDYIPGTALDKHMAGHKPPLRDVLRLFAKICEAVNAAHLRGVIHRDLKPGNILVDGKGEPYVLDFGLAKFYHVAGEIEHADSARVVTITGQFVGSAPWASPEQSLGESDKVDIRSDVYALGVIAFQMLTGQFPYEVTGNIRDVLDRIAQQAPTRPSALNSEVNDEVETIVLKCLAKEPQRRYQTAGEVARDIDHFLNGRPIEAKRDSSWYVLKKSLHRHKVATAIVAAFALLVTVSSVALSMLYREAKTQAVLATRQRERALLSEKTAEGRRVEAERQAAKASQIQSFLESMLASIDPETAKGQDSALLRTVLEVAAQRVERELHDQPEVEASVRATIGNVYRSLGHYASAVGHLESVVEVRRRLYDEASPQVAEALNDLGRLRTTMGDYDQAEALFDEAYGIYREQGLEENAEAAGVLANRAVLLAETGRHDEAETLGQRVLDMRRKLHGPKHADIAESLNNLAVLKTSVGKFEEAEALHREALDMRRDLFGENHPLVAQGWHNVASVLQALGSAEAEPMFRRALAARRRLFDEDHPAIASTLNSLATLLLQLGRYDEARRAFEEALRINRKRLGNEHQLVAKILSNLGAVSLNTGDLEAAEESFRESLRIFRNLFGEKSKFVAGSLNNLANVLKQRGEFADAEPYFRESLALCRELLGDGHPHTAQTKKNLAELLALTGRSAEAEPLFQEALKSLEESIGREHSLTAHVRAAYGDCLTRLGRFQDAEERLVDAYEVLERTVGIEHAHTQAAGRALINLYQAWERPAELARYERIHGAGKHGAAPRPAP